MAEIIPYQYKRIWELLHVLEIHDIVFRNKRISFKASNTVLLTERMKNKLS